MPEEQPYIPRFASLNGRDNSASEVGNAINGFADAIKQVQVTRSLNSATEEIQNLRQQEASDSQIRQRQSELAQSLGQKMIGFGYPVSQTQMAMANILPAQPQYDTPAQLLAYAPEEVRQRYIEGQQQLKPAKEPDPIATALKNQKVQDAEDSQKFKVLGGLQKKVNDAEQTSRSVFGQLAAKRDRLTDLAGLLGNNPSQWKNLTNIQIQELATNLDSVFRGGVATEGGVQGLIPHTINSNLAKMREFSTSKPSPANLEGFVRLYADTIDRTGGIINAQIRGYKKNTLGAIPSIAKKYQDDFPELSRRMLGEEAHFENGKVVFESDAQEGKVVNALKVLTKPENATDPRALGILQNIEEDPHYWDALMTNKNLANQVRALKSRLRAP